MRGLDFAGTRIGEVTVMTRRIKTRKSILPLILLLVVVLLTAAIPFTPFEVEASDLPDQEEAYPQEEGDGFDPPLPEEEGDLTGIPLGARAQSDPDLPLERGAEPANPAVDPVDDPVLADGLDETGLLLQAPAQTGTKEGREPPQVVADPIDPITRPGLDEGQEQDAGELGNPEGEQASRPGSDEGLEQITLGDWEPLGDPDDNGNGMSIGDQLGELVIEKVLVGEDDSRKIFTFKISKWMDPLPQASQGSRNRLELDTGLRPPIGDDSDSGWRYVFDRTVSVEAGKKTKPIELSSGTYKIEEVGADGYEVSYRVVDEGQDSVGLLLTKDGALEGLLIKAGKTTELLVTNRKKSEPGRLSVKQTILGIEDPDQIRHYTLEMAALDVSILPDQNRRPVGDGLELINRTPLEEDPPRGGGLGGTTKGEPIQFPFDLMGNQTKTFEDIQAGAPYLIQPLDDSNLKEIRCDGHPVDQARFSLESGQSIAFEFIYELPVKKGSSDLKDGDLEGDEKILGEGDVKVLAGGDVKVVATGEGKPYLLPSLILALLALALGWLGRRGLARNRLS